MRGFRRADPLWGQLCKLREETVLPEVASLMLGVGGGRCQGHHVYKQDLVLWP